MQLLRKLIYVIIALLIAFSAFALISGKTYLFKAAYYNFANIDDYTIFSNNTVVAVKEKPWAVSSNYNQVAYPDSLNQLMEKLSTVGLLMIKNDSILMEKYWDGYSDSSLSGSFSMAKSINLLNSQLAISFQHLKKARKQNLEL
jgi:hypothetical protein